MCCFFFFFWIVIIVIYFFWNNFMEENRPLSFFFWSLTSVLLLALGRRPPASNKGWFMQMDEEAMLLLLFLPPSHPLSVCTCISISPDSRVTSCSPLLREIKTWISLCTDRGDADLEGISVWLSSRSSDAPSKQLQHVFCDTCASFFSAVLLNSSDWFDPTKRSFQERKKNK